MKKLISFRLAANISVAIYSAVMLFHAGILAGLIPNDIVWGGRIPEEQLPVFEVFSIFLNAVFLLITLIHAGYIKAKGFVKVARIGMWVIFAVFLLNTIGNVFAVTDFEKFVFTPMTLILALLALRMAIEKRIDTGE